MEQEQEENPRKASKRKNRKEYGRIRRNAEEEEIAALQTRLTNEAPPKGVTDYMSHH